MDNVPILAVEPLIGQGTSVDQTIRTDQFKEIVLRIVTRNGGELRDEALDRECMRDVGDGAKPADPGVRVGFWVFYASAPASLAE